MKTNNDYCRDKVYEAEHGICQLCGFDAHSLFKQVRYICWVISLAFSLSEFAFEKIIQEYYTIRVSNSLDSDQAQSFVGP